jgi:hypothetical protein
MHDRLAVLVIHGMGSQKPYETLDEFARGIETSLTPPAAGAYRHELRFRQFDNDPAHQQKAWTQAYVRLTPTDPSAAAAASHPALIDVSEYYWAPIINDRVSALQSLRFLLKSAFSPFQYLRANALMIDWASQESPLLVIVREVARSCFIFAPFIALLGVLYGLLAQPLLTLLTRTSGSPAASQWIPYFWTCASITWPSIFILSLVAFRWLLIVMAILYFVDAARHPKPRPDVRERIRVYDLAILTLLICLIAVPFAWHGIWETLLRIPFLSGVPTIRNLFHSVTWFSDFRHFAHRYLVFAPFCLRLVHLTWYLLLGVLIYAIRLFLTTAIGGLAVYLGSDTLSKNFAARSQILSECTAAVQNLLALHPDVPAASGQAAQYDRVILAAHSLGTVIAYDTLNDLRVMDAAEFDEKHVARIPAPSAPELARITALFTFGCPLNKVYYFFRARVGEKATILSQVLYSLHNFRLHVPAPTGILPPEPPGNKPFSPTFKWFNVWCKLDLISGPMLFYQADENERVRQGFEPATAHTGYWANPHLYEYFSRLL